MNSVMSKIINLMKIKKFQKAELEIYNELKKDPQSFDLNKKPPLFLLMNSLEPLGQSEQIIVFAPQSFTT